MATHKEILFFAGRKDANECNKRDPAAAASHTCLAHASLLRAFFAAAADLAEEKWEINSPENEGKINLKEAI